MTARTPAGTPPPAARITILDILRALALLGIVIVHTHDHFNLYLPMPPAEGWQAAANSAADWAYEHLFVSKSFLLFSFLFGLSFFIQLDRREQQGIDFRKRFMWRLTLLFLLGLAHTLFYDGDILTLFGTLGFALVMLYKCGTPLLITLCALCLIQPVMLMDRVARGSRQNHDFIFYLILFRRNRHQMRQNGKGHILKRNRRSVKQLQVIGAASLHQRSNLRCVKFFIISPFV